MVNKTFLAPSGVFAATSPASGEGSFLAPSGGFAATSPTSGEGSFLAPSGGFAATSPASGEVNNLVRQAGELRSNIQRAQTDLQASSDRTQANARRVDEIQRVIELLNDIADQTALLALNAAIEAARAGDTGRGFAVVADEVRRLAERSKAAAADIAKLAQGAQSTSREAAAAIERRGEQLDRWMALTKTMEELAVAAQVAGRG